MSQQHKVIVIGGGLAGLSAAHTILENGGSVVLLDKSAFLGGNSTKATSGINGACQFIRGRLAADLSFASSSLSLTKKRLKRDALKNTRFIACTRTHRRHHRSHQIKKRETTSTSTHRNKDERKSSSAFFSSSLRV